jgi:hypothetical protein
MQEERQITVRRITDEPVKQLKQPVRFSKDYQCTNQFRRHHHAGGLARARARQLPSDAAARSDFQIDGARLPNPRVTRALPRPPHPEPNARLAAARHHPRASKWQISEKVEAGRSAASSANSAALSSLKHTSTR